MTGADGAGMKNNYKKHINNVDSVDSLESVWPWGGQGRHLASWEEGRGCP